MMLIGTRFEFEEKIETWQAIGLPYVSMFTAQRASLSWKNKAGRVLWNFCRMALYRSTPTVFHGWRRFLLRCFGATIAGSARPYPRARVWAPWNLVMQERSCLADDVDCYCVGRIE